LCLKGRRVEEARSEKSAEAEVAASRRRQGRLPAYRKPQARQVAKGRTEGRAKRT
jgi:hypothetical protein